MYQALIFCRNIPYKSSLYLGPGAAKCQSGCPYLRAPEIHKERPNLQVPLFLKTTGCVLPATVQNACFGLLWIALKSGCTHCTHIWRTYNMPRLRSAGFVYSGYGYGRPPELTEVPGTGTGTESHAEPAEIPSIEARAYRTYRSSGQVIKMLSCLFPGCCGLSAQNLQKFRVRA